MKRKKVGSGKGLSGILYTLVWEVSSDEMRFEWSPECKEKASIVFVSEPVIWHLVLFLCEIKLQIDKPANQQNDISQVVNVILNFSLGFLYSNQIHCQT